MPLPRSWKDVISSRGFPGTQSQKRKMKLQLVLPLKGAEKFISSDPPLMKLIYNLVSVCVRAQGTGTGTLLCLHFAECKTQAPSLLQDVCLKPKLKRVFKEPEFLSDLTN